MKQLTLLSLIIIASALTALAQSGGDYNKWDLYGGYSLGRFETNVESASFTSGGSTQSFTNLCSSATGDMIGPNFQKFFCERRNFNGFEGSMAYNVSRYVGLKADVTGHFKSQTYVDTFTPPGVKQTISNKERLWNFLGGVQIKDNSRDKRVKPFAHALAGVARYTNRQSQTLDLFPQFNFVIEDRDTSFALKLGGGLDIRASEHVDIRVIEFDYNPVFAGDRQAQTISGPFNPVRFEGKTAHNFTIGFGIVIH
ncbi:MAG TPA: outer membrane beta-barrel protein [Pyrinomonadaceae bacterium]|jgi:opacity protein-like surface antigen